MLQIVSKSSPTFSTAVVIPPHTGSHDDYWHFEVSMIKFINTRKQKRRIWKCFREMLNCDKQKVPQTGSSYPTWPYPTSNEFHFRFLFPVSRSFLCYSDFLLYVPVTGSQQTQWMVIFRLFSKYTYSICWAFCRAQHIIELYRKAAAVGLGEWFYLTNIYPKISPRLGK